jgi:hypothetical protein
MSRNKCVMLSLSILIGTLTGMSMPSAGWAQGFLGGATGSVDKVRQELQQLGTQAAQHAKKAEQAAQEAEQFANTLSGNAKNDAQQAAQDARQKATQAKAKADHIQSQASQPDADSQLDGLRQAAEDAKQMGAEAQGHAKRAKDAAGSLKGNMKNDDTGMIGQSDESRPMDAGATSSQGQRSVRNPKSRDAETSMGLQKSEDVPSSTADDQRPSR